MKEDQDPPALPNTPVKFSSPQALLKPKPKPMEVPSFVDASIKVSPFVSQQTKIPPIMTTNNTRIPEMTPLSPTPSVLSLSDTHADNYIGSFNNPYTIFVDLEYPEQNSIFDIVHVKRIEYGGWAREGIDIRTKIGLDDVVFWSAWMQQGCEAEFQDRVVMIRGKSRSSTYNRVDSYH